MSYAPRPGSKTAAAIEFIRAQGGTAFATAIRDECDIDIKNMPSMFKAAITGGILEYAEDVPGMAFRLCAEAPQAPSLSRAEQLAKELQVSQAIPAKRSGSRAMARTPKVVPGIELQGRGRRAHKATPPQPAQSISRFRCGVFSDGSLRLEGAGDMLTVEAFEGERIAISIQPSALRLLADFLKRR